MPANLYECLVLLDTSKYNANAAATVETLHGIITKQKAEIVVSRPWDERRLMYPVEGQKKGTYFLIYFRGEGSALEPIRADFALNETVLRSLILKIHPKLEETMLTVARDEHAGVALQASGQGDDDSLVGGREYARS